MPIRKNCFSTVFKSTRIVLVKNNWDSVHWTQLLNPKKQQMSLKFSNLHCTSYCIKALWYCTLTKVSLQMLMMQVVVIYKPILAFQSNLCTDTHNFSLSFVLFYSFNTLVYKQYTNTFIKCEWTIEIQAMKLNFEIKATFIKEFCRGVIYHNTLSYEEMKRRYNT